GQNGRPALDTRLGGDASGEVQAEQPAAHDRGADAHETAMMEQRHARARAGAARRRIDLSWSPHERVRRDALRVRQLVNENVVDGGLADARDVDAQLRVHGVAHRHPALGDALDLLAPPGDADARGFDDGEDVADTDGDVERQFAHTLDLDDLIRQRHERRRPAQRDLAHAVAVRARERFHDPGLGVDDDARLVTLSRDQPRLERDGRRADRPLAARDVVAAGGDEEQPELWAGPDGIGIGPRERAPLAA